MTLKFDGKIVPGTTTAFVFHSPEIQMRRVLYWDVNGEGEIVGKPGGRAILVSHILHNEYESYTDLKRDLNLLSDAIGTHGRLEMAVELHGNPVVESLTDVTFDSWERVPLEGQAEAGPLKDVSRTLFDDDGEADEGWFQAIRLTFRQLIV